MGENAASELLEIFKSWDEDEGNTAFRKRGEPENMSTYHLWSQQSRASYLMHQVHQFLDLHDDPDEWTDFIRDAWDFVYLTRDDWASSDSRHRRMPSNVRAGLAGLRRTMGQFSASVDWISVEDLASLRETLEKIDEELRAIPTRHREYVDDIRLKIAECLRLIDGEPSGADLAQARERGLQIAGESLPAVLLVSEERRQSLFGLILALAGTFVGQVLTGVSAELLSQHLLQLSQ